MDKRDIDPQVKSKVSDFLKGFESASKTKKSKSISGGDVDLTAKKGKVNEAIPSSSKNNKALDKNSLQNEDNINSGFEDRKVNISDNNSDISDKVICEGFGEKWRMKDVYDVKELIKGLPFNRADLLTFVPPQILDLAIESLKTKPSKPNITENRIKVNQQMRELKELKSSPITKDTDKLTDSLTDKIKTNLNQSPVTKEGDKKNEADKVKPNDNEGFELSNGESKINPQINLIDDSYQLIESNEDLVRSIELLRDEKVLGIDTETTGLDCHLHKLRLIQIASQNNPTLIIDCFKCDVKLLQPLLLNASVKIFHNAKFDIQFLMSKGLEVSQTIFDTQLAHQLVNSGKANIKASLKVIASEYLGIELSKEERLTDWSKEELTEAQLRYSSIDAKILLRLREILRDKLVSASLVRVAKIEFDCVLAVAMMEFNGMLLDVNQWQNILEDSQKRKDKLEIELQNIFKEKIANFSNNNIANSINKSEQLTLIANDFDFSEEINLDSPSQLKEALNKADIKVNDTNSKTLKKLLPQYPEILKPLLEYKKLSKLISSFGDSLLKKINPITGRLHGSYWQLGSQSGRFTSSEPNLQQIPRNKESRSCFVASPNHKLVIADYSQIELRIASEVANDRTMIEAYNRGEDLHKLTASIVLNKPLDEVSKEDRQIAKSANFGLIYGASVNGFRGYAESNYGISLSENEAKKIMDNFFKSYSGLANWHKKTKSRIYNGGINETRTLSDRIRYFDNASPQQILNTPIQGTGADMVKLALGRLVSALKPFNGKVKLLATVHDEIILEAHEDIADQVAKVLSEVMVNSGKEFLKRVPIEADSSIGNNWSDK